MEHHIGFEITPAGRAFIAANGPVGGCAAWVGARQREAWADTRAREIHARIMVAREGRSRAATLPPA